MFSESPPSYRAVVVPQLVTPGLAIPVWWDEVDTAIRRRRKSRWKACRSRRFPQLHKQVKGVLPSGQLWEAYKTLFDINSTLQRMIALPPGAPRAAYDALSKAIERLNHDKDFAAEAIKTIEFVPDYPTAPDMSQKVRAMLHASPQMRAFINDYMNNVPKR